MVLSEWFGSWLLEQLADATRRWLGTWLLGSEQERALRAAGQAAIARTARDLRPAASDQDLDDLARVLDHVFEADVPVAPLEQHATMLQALQAGLAAQLAVLDDPALTGTGQSSAEVLGLSIEQITETLTRNTVQEILVRGAGGGPLEPLANQLNHDLTHLQGQHFVGTLDRVVKHLTQLPELPAGAPIAGQLRPGPFAVAIGGRVHNLVVGQASLAGAGPTAALPAFLAPPPPPQGIVGREQALTEILDLLQVDDDQATEVAPVALRGLGGVGKTTLAVAVGRLDTVVKRFPDGVLWVALGPDPTIRVLLEGWGRAVGVDLLPERDEQACSQRLRAALYERRALLIVDDVWEERHGRYFLVAGPRCRTLITTREPPTAYALATRARTRPVDLLTPEASLQLLERLAPQVVALDRSSAEALCERLEFLPLALTLAGRFLAAEADVPGRLRRTVDELMERRQARLQLLQAEGRLGLSEDQPVSLGAMLGLSVDRLQLQDRERFAMLAVFGGDPLTWEVEAAAAVWDCTVEEAEDTVARLIRRGLVEPRGSQYWMHALLADYASELLDQLPG